MPTTMSGSTLNNVVALANQPPSRGQQTFHTKQASRKARPMAICVQNPPGSPKAMQAYTPTTQQMMPVTMGR